LLDLVPLAVTLAMLSLGLAIIAWGWRNAHMAAASHASHTAHHHQAQSNPEVTPEERHP
jgi:hypothetical protein